MKIEILGTGCPKCKQLEENAKKALGYKSEFRCQKMKNRC